MPNDVLYTACGARSFLDACASLRPKMKTELACIDRGKEILTQSRDEQQTHQAESQQARREQFAVIEAELEQARIAASNRLEAALEGMMDPREDAAPVLCVGIRVPGGFLLHQVL